MKLAFHAKDLQIRIVCLVINLYIFTISPVFHNVRSKIIILLNFQFNRAINVMKLAYSVEDHPIKTVCLVIKICIFTISPAFLNVLCKIIILLKFPFKNALNAMTHALLVGVL